MNKKTIIHDLISFLLDDKCYISAINTRETDTCYKSSKQADKKKLTQSE